MRYFVGLGSNIEPRANVPLMLRALLQLSPTLFVGRVLETAPVAVAGDPFLNVPVCLASDLTPQELKQFCNAVEARLGRDRGDPGSKVKSRPADLDILFWLEEDATRVAADLLPQEPYMRPMLLELLGALDLAAEAEAPRLPAGVALSFGAISVGAEPARLDAAGEGLVVTRLVPAPAQRAPRGATV